MKKMLFIIFALICIIGVGSYTWADPVGVELGYHTTNYNNYSGKVGEYGADQDSNHGIEGIDFHLLGDIQDDAFYLGVDGHYYEDSDYSYWIGGDYKRILNQNFSGKRFEHQLDHDLMENLSASGGGPKTSHEDFSIGKDYMIKYSEYNSDTVLNLPFLPGTQINFNYHNQRRYGYRQSSVMSHCAGCHITSRAREVDEETEDLKIGITKKFDWVTVAYDYFHREFNEDGKTPENAYDDAMHPATSGPKEGGHFFDDRVSYDGESLSYNLVPIMEKDTHTVKAQIRLPVDTVLFTSYIHSGIENKNSDLETDSEAVAVKVTNNFFPGLNLAGKFRYLSINNDNIYVDIDEPIAVGGKNEGFSWYDYKPTLTYNSLDPDFIRKSAMSRDVTTAGFDARYQLFRKTFLNLDYEWEQIDRDHYVVEKTKKNTIKTGLTTRPHRKVKVKLGYKWQDIDDPFANINGVCETGAFPATTNNPWLNSIQYWERQNMRTADVSNQPTRIDEITTNINWSILCNLSLTTNYRYTEKENDQTNYSDWEQESHMLTTNLWYAPISKLNFNLSYIYDKAKTESFVCVPVYDG